MVAYFLTGDGNGWLVNGDGGNDDAENKDDDVDAFDIESLGEDDVDDEDEDVDDINGLGWLYEDDSLALRLDCRLVCWRRSVVADIGKELGWSAESSTAMLTW